jgi:2-polyprenyl-3-methyl-5-hydroxy-6-metoxy-1,4-benzoquinol methylase
MRVDLDGAAIALLRERLVARYATVPDAIIETSNGRDVREQYRADIENHINGRLNEFRNKQLRWLAKHIPLDGCRVLEIGCGTGSSTVALGVAGAVVDGVDIDAGALEAARLRCNLHELTSINLFEMNGTEIHQFSEKYDLILFFATFEHMTHCERKNSLAKAWNLLRHGGIVGFIECPNRLWYFDNHTTFANFYNWLPDEMAMDYAHVYARDLFRTEFDDGIRDEGASTRLARWGRGASYHDIEVVLGPISGLDVLEGAEDYRRSMDIDLDRWWSDSDEGRYRGLLMKFAPHIPSAFFYPWLDILIRKR